jgi:hypothetical protein
MAAVTESTTARLHQFSLRTLFKLTLVVSLLLTLGVMTTPWAPITFAIVIAVWFVDRTHLVAPRWLAIGSIGLFGLSLCLPAVNLHFKMTFSSSDYTVFGWNAFLASYVVLPEILFGSWLWNKPDEIDFAFAYVVGAMANTAYLLGYVANLLSARFPRARTFARRAAILAFCFAAADFSLLFYTGELRDIFPGFGFWAASMLALALGTRRA